MSTSMPTCTPHTSDMLKMNHRSLGRKKLPIAIEILHVISSTTWYRLFWFPLVPVAVSVRWHLPWMLRVTSSRIWMSCWKSPRCRPIWCLDIWKKQFEPWGWDWDPHPTLNLVPCLVMDVGLGPGDPAGDINAWYTHIIHGGGSWNVLEWRYP